MARRGQRILLHGRMDKTVDEITKRRGETQGDPLRQPLFGRRTPHLRRCCQTPLKRTLRERILVVAQLPPMRAIRGTPTPSSPHGERSVSTHGIEILSGPVSRSEPPNADFSTRANDSNCNQSRRAFSSNKAQKSNRLFNR